eukprot:2275246-Pyramimonas_sp.AAC.1
MRRCDLVWNAYAWMHAPSPPGSSPAARMAAALPGHGAPHGHLLPLASAAQSKSPTRAPNTWTEPATRRASRPGSSARRAGKKEKSESCAWGAPRTSATATAAPEW